MNQAHMDNVISHGNLTGISNSNMHVEWSFCNMCNYHCSYCTGYDKFDKQNLSTKKDIFFALDNIFSLNRKSYSFNFLGGEPTLHPELIPCLQKIHSSNKIVSTSVVTNGSQSLHYFEKYASVVSNVNHHLMISFHVERASFEHIREVIKLASNKNIFVSVFFMNSYVNDFSSIENGRIRNFELIEKFLCLRKEVYFNFSINNILSLPNLDNFCSYYTKNDFSSVDNFHKNFNQIGSESKVSCLHSFKNLSESYYVLTDGDKINVNDLTYEFTVSNNLRNFSDFYCVNGASEIFINDEGECFGAKCKSKQFICNIFNERLNDKALLHVVKCSDPACTCPSNDSLPKFRHKKDADKFVEENLFCAKCDGNISVSERIVQSDSICACESVQNGIFEDDNTRADTDEYLAFGRSALHVINTYLYLSDIKQPQKILDFGYSAERVTRWLCAAFPDASITASDVREEDLDFIHKTSNVKAIQSSESFDFSNFREKYNCIWVGSVFTHLSVSRSFELFLKLFYLLEVGGIIIATFHGRRAIEFMNGGVIKYIEDSRWSTILEDFNKTGYGYADYPEMVNWGVSLIKPSWFVRFFESKENMRLIGITEKGWADHQDVFCVQRIK